MSRTTRTLPKWLTKQIAEENQYRNGYRGVKWYGYGSHDMLSYKDGDSAQQRTDISNRHRSLYRTCRNSVCVGHKVKMNGWMFDVSSGDTRRMVKKRYHKLCRQANKLIAWNEFVDDYYGDDEDDGLHRKQEEACEEYYEFEGDLYSEMDWIISEQEINHIMADVA